MSKRQKDVLLTCIESFIETCEPISSQELVKTSFSDVSSATIRNDMAFLEREGYLVSPHTSSGRIPTQQAYQFYVQQTDLSGHLTKQQLNTVKEVISQMTGERDAMKQLAKTLVPLIDGCVIVIFSKQDHYYTGVSHLLTKKDFSNPTLLYNISEIIDRLDDVLSVFHDEIQESILIRIGNENPLSKLCTTFALSFNKQPFSGKLIFLTPMRTSYKTAYRVLDYLQSAL